MAAVTGPEGSAGTECGTSFEAGAGGGNRDWVHVLALDPLYFCINLSNQPL